MTNVELGKGLNGIDTVNIFHAGACKADCPYLAGDPHCLKTNGDRVITFQHGVTKNTVNEVEKTARCIIGN